MPKETSVEMILVYDDDDESHTTIDNSLSVCTLQVVVVLADNHWLQGTIHNPQVITDWAVENTDDFLGFRSSDLCCSRNESSRNVQTKTYNLCELQGHNK